jgi:predicted DCC family thiol-disulfide oxidoreductase YuxK
MAEQNGEKIVLFDETCSLCAGSVRFIARHDPAGQFRFAGLDSAVGRNILARHGRTREQTRSVVLVEPGRLATHSTAVLRIARHLPWPWRAAAAGIIVPRFLRDGVYGVFARYRRKWFGETCGVIAPEVRSRMLEQESLCTPDGAGGTT